MWGRRGALVAAVTVGLFLGLGNVASAAPPPCRTLGCVYQRALGEMKHKPPGWAARILRDLFGP